MSRQVLAGALALAIVVVIVAVIFVFGVVSPPEYGSLHEDPDPAIPGTVAFVRSDEGQACVYTVPAGGGQERRMLCDGGRAGEDGIGLSGPGMLGWTPRGDLLVLSRTEAGPTVRVMDPSTAEVTMQFSTDASALWYASPDRHFHAASQSRSERGDGAKLLWGRDQDRGYVSFVHEGRTRVLISEEGPRDYAFQHAQWSPEGAHVLAQDSLQRLVVADAAGEREPRLLATDAREAAWFVPGQHIYTIELETLQELE